jgi:hypothetical protein
MKKEIRNIQPFSKIHFKDFGNIILTQGDQVSLTIEADEELLPDLISDVHNGTLTLGLEKDWFERFGKVVASVFSGVDQKVTYTLTCVDLEKINVSGKCHLKCDSLKTDNLELKVSGLGDLYFSSLRCDSLKLRISGRGEFYAAGQVDHQDIQISGSGEVQTPNLASQSTKIAISGQGNATVRAQDNLDIAISGMGRVNYYGQPSLRQVISGLGRSKKLNDE